jgi:hypothetical protein
MWQFNWGVFWAIVAAGIVLWVLWLLFVACYNYEQRFYALRLAQSPMLPTPRADALRKAREKLGPNASVREIMAEANKTEQA